jgi:hypothetical protein
MKTADPDRGIQERIENAENGGGGKNTAKINNSSTDEYLFT